MRALYLTHPQVQMDPLIPVPLWSLSDEGRQRVEHFIARRTIPAGAFVFTSRETKAMQMADLFAEITGTPALSDHLMGENDRTATGFLPAPLFEATADAFFAAPDTSIDGWETASDAQVRIVATVGLALQSVPPDTPAIFCGHGAVGTLLKCHLGGLPISREEDQSRRGAQGGGNGFVFDMKTLALLTDWVPMEDILLDWWKG
ncbi:MAG: histidine phosphatase family protein [Devosia sp.]|uniref:histidine phosphatase family protein n=1 Tax=unclassified Devosia TaxID=196773 RepID=UPI0019F01EE4|nr:MULTISPECIES: histidine phosphatase family protein [unclassified Devosia]MBF0677337.1 histidine phosphatase family protein [Devosia sp.]WEJ33399.1 phosphoglycerate mutase family protein [Devosia sp. SD17-2]